MLSDLDFLRAVALVLVNEGGSRFTNNAIDRGGPTRYGITLTTLSAWRKKPVVENDVRNLQEQEAKDIYRANYWNPLRCQDMDVLGLAAVVFDAAVLSGTANAARILQTAVGDLKVDGSIGPKTLAALKAADAAEVVQKFSALLQRYFVSLVRHDASQQVFLVGWVKRAAAMQALFFISA